VARSDTVELLFKPLAIRNPRLLYPADECRGRTSSGARRQVDWTRCCLSATTIQILECLKHWLTTGITHGAFQNTVELQEAEEAVEKAIQLAQKEAGSSEATPSMSDDEVVTERQHEEEAAAGIIQDLECRRHEEQEQQETSEGSQHQESDID